MTWREGSNQAGFSNVGLHKIHHDDIPQVLTEKQAAAGVEGMMLKTRGNGITVFEEIDGKATWDFIGNSRSLTKKWCGGGVVCQNFANFTANFTGFAVFLLKTITS